MDEDDCLQAHNEKRALHQNTPDLVWDANLAQQAKDWADTLAYWRNLTHAGVTGQGENLYWGTGRSAKTCREAVQSWWVPFTAQVMLLFDLSQVTKCVCLVFTICVVQNEPVVSLSLVFGSIVWLDSLRKTNKDENCFLSVWTLSNWNMSTLDHGLSGFRVYHTRTFILRTYLYLLICIENIFEYKNHTFKTSDNGVRFITFCITLVIDKSLYIRMITDDLSSTYVSSSLLLLLLFWLNF